MSTEAIAAARCHICRRRIGSRAHYVTKSKELVHVACLEQQWRIAIRDAEKGRGNFPHLFDRDVRGGAA